MNSRSDLDLEQSYANVFRKSEAYQGFDAVLQEKSRSLFVFDSETGKAIPKDLEVYALVGGLEFSDSLKQFAIGIQQLVDKLIGTSERYWVAPHNFGVEYIVTKWPEQKTLSDDQHNDFISFVHSLNLNTYTLRIRGFQVHTDGCVVLRGYDEGNLLDVRNILTKRFSWLPARQSGWAHIPIGRILSPLNEDIFKTLISECRRSFDHLHLDERIDELKYVHEKRWYMERKSFMHTFNLRYNEGKFRA